MLVDTDMSRRFFIEGGGGDKGRTGDKERNSGRRRKSIGWFWKEG